MLHSHSPNSEALMTQLSLKWVASAITSAGLSRDVRGHLSNS